MNSQVAVGIKDTTKKRSQIKFIWHRFKKNKLAMIGLFMLIVLTILSISAPLLRDYDKDVISQDVKIRFQSPNREHILGTDQYGRDIFARIIYGGRISLSMGFAVVAIAMLFGSIIGASAGYYGGKIDNILMRIMDVFLAIPQILMAMAIVAALGTDIKNLLMAMTIANIPKFARIVRSAILQIRNQEFIEAARACGTSDARIILKHIIPNAIGPIIVQATLNIAQTIIGIAGLSFIGLGIQPPKPEWGTMLAEAKSQMRNYPYLVIVPGLSIMMAVLAFNLIGDGLRDALDPKLKN